MESFEGMLTKLGKQFYAVVCLGAVLLSAAVVHYVCADESDSDERRRRERTMKRFRALHGPPLRSTYF